MAIVAFCFSMTIGVVWEFFEFGMDQIMGYDMQKDTVIHVIRSVTLDPAGRNVPAVIDHISSTAVNGTELDVYKRQSLSGGRVHARRHSQVLLLEQRSGAS